MSRPVNIVPDDSEDKEDGEKVGNVARLVEIMTDISDDVFEILN